MNGQQGADGAKLEEHSRRKLKILREYVFDYLTVRCQLPQQQRLHARLRDVTRPGASPWRSLPSRFFQGQGAEIEK